MRNVILPLFVLLAAAQSAPAPFEQEIKAFEQSDAKNPPPKNAVLFIGSSSIRLWKTLADDFPDLKVINRGFGGSQIEHSNRYFDKIVAPYRPKLIVFYAGGNDVAAGKGPQRVLADFKTFVEKVRTSLPGTRVLFISIRPSVARRHLHGREWLTNALRSNSINVPPSQGNFILALFKDAETTRAAFTALRDKGLLVREMHSYGIANGLRITIGLEAPMRAVAEVLKEFGARGAQE